MEKKEAPAPRTGLGRAIAAYQKTISRERGTGNGEQGAESRGQGGQARGLEKKTLPQDKASKYHRTAQFLVLVGSEKAAEILSRLPRDQVEEISKEIVSLKGISPEEEKAVLEEFRFLLSRPCEYAGAVSGGVDEARRLLYAAFGPEKGEALLRQAAPQPQEEPFGFLKDFSPEQLAFLFKDESPAAEAMVLSRLPAKLSAQVLKVSDKERKLDIARRIARMSQISPEVLEQAASALREKARHIGRTESAGPDGLGALTAILKASDAAFGEKLIEELEEEDPGLGRSLKDRLYTLEDVCGAEDRPLEEHLRAMPDKDIALLLKGKSGAFTQKILSNVSKERQGMILEEGEIMGSVPNIEAEAAAREFLAWFRQSREEGKIIMKDEKDVVL